jgi:cysteine synthase B
LKSLEEAIIPKIYNPAGVDRHILVETEPAYEMARKLVSEEGIFVGMSSGGALIAALQVVSELKEGVVVVILPDRGEKYLSTKLYQLETSDAKAPVVAQNSTS